MPKPLHPRRRIDYRAGKISSILTPRSRRAHCPETIVCAAIRLHPSKQEPRVVSLPRPAKHRDIINAVVFDLRLSLLGSEMGFLTSAGRFVLRDEALVVAEKCGQVTRILGRSLTSEDLW